MKKLLIAIILLFALSGCSTSDLFISGRTSDFWNTSGNVLEPTNSSYDLQVPSLASCDTIDTDSDGLFSCGTDGGGTGGGESLWATSTPTATNIYYTAGNVGIGTTTPNYKLTVYGTASTTIQYANTLFIPPLATPAGSFLAINPSGQVIATTTPTGGGAGTVSSVDMSVPTGLTIGGNPITTSGTLALSLTGGYNIPKTASTSEWATAYGWGNHASAGYLTSIAAGTYDPYGQATSSVATHLLVQADTDTIGHLTDTDWDTFNGKWTLTTGVFDPYGQATSTLASHTTTYNHANYDTAYGWGNHSTAGYLSSSLYYATTTHRNISSLPSLSITKSQVSDFGSYDVLGQATSSVSIHNTAYNHASFLTSVASDATWTLHDSYPSACTAGQYVSAVGDTLTCSTPATGVGGSGSFWATSTDNLLLYPVDYNTQTVVIGNNATSTTGLKLEVNGKALFTYASSTGMTATNFWGALIGNASTATALAGNPSDCAAGTCATAIDASGNLTCSITPLVSTSIDTIAELNTILTGEDVASTTYFTAGDALTLTVNDFDFDGGASPGGSLGGTWASPTVDSDGTWTGHNDYPTACGMTGGVVNGIGDTLTCTATSTWATIALSDSTWTLHNSYPAACGANQFVTTLGDTNTCSAVADITCTDCLNATEIEDIYLLDDGDVGTGNYDFGGATFFEIPNGATPTADDVGELAHDTSDNQLILDDYVIPTTFKIWSVTVASTSRAFIDAGLLPAPQQIDGYTITRISCYVSGGTSKVIAVEDASANSSEDVTCDADGAVDDGSITNATYTASELSNIDFGASSGNPNYVTISVFGTITRE